MSLFYIAVDVDGRRKARITRSLQCTFTYNLCSAYDLVCDPGPYQVSRHLDKAGEDGCPDALEAVTALGEVHQAQVAYASQLGSPVGMPSECLRCWGMTSSRSSDLGAVRANSSL